MRSNARSSGTWRDSFTKATCYLAAHIHVHLAGPGVVAAQQLRLAALQAILCHMAQSARVHGTVMLRPLRGALIDKELTVPGLVRSTTRASSRWGGLHFPIFAAPKRADDLYAQLAALGVDFCWTDSQDPHTRELCQKDGYAWLGGRELGPFATSDWEFNDGLLDVTWLLHTLRPGEIRLPIWEATDPLNGVFSILFGGIDRETLGAQQQAEIEAVLDPVEVSQATPLHELLAIGGMAKLSQKELLSEESDTGGIGVVEIDPGNADDLARFWNLRAFGLNVVPVPLTHAEEYVQSLLVTPSLTANLDRWSGGTNASEFDVLNWWPSGGATTPHPAVAYMAKQLGAEVHEGGVGGRTLFRRNLKPAYTYFERSFDATAEPKDWQLTIDLPALPWKHGRPHGGFYVGRVAADVRLLSESGLRSDRTLNMPHYRKLAALLRQRSMMSDVNPHRPRGDGRVLGIQARTQSIELPLIPSLTLFESLIGHPDWKCGQSDEGHFASRLGELLGGPTSYVANQPALANVLDAAARKGSSGISMGEIRDRFKKFRGDWPDSHSWQTPEEYAQSHSVRLVNTRLLKPVMPLKCPACRSSLPLSPQQISEDVTCDFCGDTFALGLGLALANKNPPWSYRLASHVSREKLISTLPMIAALSLLARLEKGGATSLPHVFGLEVDDGNGRRLEVDVAAYVNDHYPAVILGEIKNHDDVNAQDLSNLAYVRGQLVAEGVEAIIMVGTMKERLSDEEKELLRRYCETADSAAGSMQAPRLTYPLIFTNRDLTANPWSEMHPWRWSAPGRGHMSLFDLAQESCRRYIDLTDQDCQRLESAAFSRGRRAEGGSS